MTRRKQTSLTIRDRILMASAMGLAKLEGREPNVEQIVDDLMSGKLERDAIEQSPHVERKCTRCKQPSFDKRTNDPDSFVCFPCEEQEGIWIERNCTRCNVCGFDRATNAPNNYLCHMCQRSEGAR
jgi:hypothetical protein